MYCDDSQVGWLQESGGDGGQVLTLGIHLGKNILQLPLGIIKDEENLEC